MRRNVCTFAGLVLFTLLMAGRAEAQYDCYEYCTGDSSCSQFCTANGQTTTCLAINACNFDCWSTCQAGVPCWQWCWDNGVAKTCGDVPPLICDAQLASNSATNVAATAEQCVASRGAPAENETGQSRVDVTWRRSDDVSASSGPVQDLQ